MVVDLTRRNWDSAGSPRPRRLQRRKQPDERRSGRGNRDLAKIIDKFDVYVYSILR